LLLLLELAGCAYSFSPGVNQATMSVDLAPSANTTQLVEAGIALDRQLELSLRQLGLLSNPHADRVLRCTVVEARTSRISTASLAATDRYRLALTVNASLMTRGGSVLWERTFTDWGTYSEGQAAEAALHETCARISRQVASSIASLSP